MFTFSSNDCFYLVLFMEGTMKTFFSLCSNQTLLIKIRHFNSQFFFPTIYKFTSSHLNVYRQTFDPDNILIHKVLFLIWHF